MVSFLALASLEQPRSGDADYVFRATPRIDSLRLHRCPIKFSVAEHDGYSPSQKGRKWARALVSLILGVAIGQTRQEPQVSII